MSFSATAKVISVTNSINGGSMSLAVSDSSNIKNDDTESVQSIQVSLSGMDFSQYAIEDEVAITFKSKPSNAS